MSPILNILLLFSCIEFYNHLFVDARNCNGHDTSSFPLDVWDCVNDDGENKQGFNMFDQTYVIAVPSKVERMKKVLEHLNMKRYMLTIPYPIPQTASDLKLLEANFTKQALNSLNDGELAISMSHRRIWQHFLGSNRNTALIFEDDVSMFGPNIIKRLELSVDSIVQNLNFTYIHLGSCFSGKCSAEIHVQNDLFQNIHGPLCFHSYVISRKGAELLLETAQSCEADRNMNYFCAVDMMTRFLKDKSTSYVIRPPLFKQSRPLIQTIKVNTTSQSQYTHRYINNSALNDRAKNRPPQVHGCEAPYSLSWYSSVNGLNDYPSQGFMKINKLLVKMATNDNPLCNSFKTAPPYVDGLYMHTGFPIDWLSCALNTTSGSDWSVSWRNKSLKKLGCTYNYEAQLAHSLMKLGLIVSLLPKLQSLKHVCSIDFANITSNSIKQSWCRNRAGFPRSINRVKASLRLKNRKDLKKVMTNGVEFRPILKADSMRLFDWFACIWKDQTDPYIVKQVYPTAPTSLIVVQVRDPINRFISSTHEVFRRLLYYICPLGPCTFTHDYWPFESARLRMENGTEFYNILIKWNQTHDNTEELILALVNDVTCATRFYGDEHFLPQSHLMIQTSPWSRKVPNKIVYHVMKSGGNSLMHVDKRIFRSWGIFTNVSDSRIESCTNQDWKVHSERSSEALLLPSSKDIRDVLEKHSSAILALCMLYIADYRDFNFKLPDACESLSNPALIINTEAIEATNYHNILVSNT